MPSFDSNIRFVYFRAEGVREYIFPPYIFLYFVADRITPTSSLFFCEYQGSWTLSTQKHSATWEQKHVYFDRLAYPLKKLLKKMEKPEWWVVRWSSRNEDLKDKKRGGSPEVLNNTAQIVLKKERYKRNTTR